MFLMSEGTVRWAERRRNIGARGGGGFRKSREKTRAHVSGGKKEVQREHCVHREPIATWSPCASVHEGLARSEPKRRKGKASLEKLERPFPLL